MTDDFDKKISALADAHCNCKSNSVGICVERNFIAGAQAARELLRGEIESHRVTLQFGECVIAKLKDKIREFEKENAMLVEALEICARLPPNKEGPERARETLSKLKDNK